MTRRAITAGILGGLLFTLGALYPALAVLTPAFIPGVPLAAANPVAHAVLLMISTIVAVGAVLFTPAMALGPGRAGGFWGGAQSGSIAGLFIGIIVCLAVALPLNGLLGWQILIPYLSPVSDPGAVEVVTYAARIFSDGALIIGVTMTAAILASVVIGGAVNAVRRAPAPGAESPSLYELAARGHMSRWFRGEDSATSVALAVGLIVGLVFAVAELQNVYILFDDYWPELGPLLSQSLGGILAVRSLPFTTLAISGILLTGGVVVALIKNPAGRFWPRVSAVILSMNIAVAVWYVQASRTAAFYSGLSPFLIARAAEHGVVIAPASVDWLAVASQPSTQVALAYLGPWIVMPLIIAAVSLAGLLFGAAYAALIPLLIPRPIDRAARVRRKLQREPNQILPITYQLFNRDSSAFDVLAHLAAQLRAQPDLARLVAAYHSLGAAESNGGTAAHAKLVTEIATLIEQHPEWRHSKEIGSAHRSLSQILTADTLEALLLIKPPAEISTTTVPPLLARVIERIKEVVEELHKVNRVDDLPSRLTFLNNALETINTAQRIVDADMRDRRQVATPYPEQPALADALERWEEVVIAATKRLKGRADVTAALKSNRAPQLPRIPVIFIVQNRGLNVAEHIRLKLRSGNDYFVVPPGETSLDILPAGENHEATLMIEPKAETKRLRLEWEVAFDDSVETARLSQFADVAEFVAPDKPFQRIFPIPYVTGTPLKDGEVFVGRQDIFDFVKENLIGAHQNNVLILHGQRRTGKTSVLYRLGDVLKDTHIAVLIDMQGKPARGAADFLFSIADDIVYAMELQGIEVPLPEKKDFDDSPEFFFRSRFVRSLTPTLGKRNLLLLFDEFEELQRRVDDGKLEPGIFSFLRNLMQHEERVDFIFAGTHKLEELGGDYWSALFNIASYKRVTFLSPAEVRRLITEPIAKYNLEYDPMAIEAIAMLTAGHPYFAQLLLHEIIVYHNESQRSYMTAADVEQSVERVLERGEAHFKYIWTESAPEEQTTLRVLAEALVGRAEINLPDLQDFGAQCGCPLGEAEAQALAALVSRDIITRNGKLYRYTVPLVEKWVRHTHPVLA